MTRTLRVRRILIGVVIAVFALTGCSSSPESPEPSDDVPSETDTSDEADTTNDTKKDTTSNSRGSASLEVGDEIFSFTLAFCSITDSDVLLHGPGREATSSDIAYLSVDFVLDPELVAGEVRVDMGESQHMASSDDFRAFDVAISGDYSLERESNLIRLTGGFRTRESLDTTSGKLTANCS